MVNNDYTHWEMYAIGGSANPTINSQGNRYAAPTNPFAKEVLDTNSLTFSKPLEFSSNLTRYQSKRFRTNLPRHSLGYQEG